MTVYMSKEFKKSKDNKDYFKLAGDLDNKKVNNYFKEASDLDKSDNNHDDEIIETGCMLVTAERLKNMIEEGYNILEVVDCGPFFSVTYSKNFNKGKGR